MKSAALFACSLLSAAQASDLPNIVELAESVKDLSTLVSAVVAADLADTLSSPGPFTVFAPTNDAFNALPDGTLDSLMRPENKAQLVDILTYHVLPTQVKSSDLRTGLQCVATVQGKNVIVNMDAHGVKVGPSKTDLKKVTAADNLASNGVAHIIDGVMLPPAKNPTATIVDIAESQKDLQTLVSAVVAADLVDALSGEGPFTLFAPTNRAFADLPAGTLNHLLKPENKAQLVDVLTYHVLPEEVLTTTLNHKTYSKKTVEGKTLKVQSYVYAGQSFLRVGAGSCGNQNCLIPVTSADNVACNGVVHIISGVIPFPADPLPNIVELAESVADLSTLVAAVVAGDLADTLSSPGPFTVFAPTNAAFNALPDGTLDSLMKPENKGQLVDILTYHVLPVKAAVADLDLFQPSTTVEGKPLHITKWGSTVKVGPSLKSEDLKTVTGPDNMANNGVAHIIDGVLLPPTGAVVV